MGLFSDIAQVGGELLKATRIGGERMEPGRGPGSALLADPSVWAVAGYNYKEKPAAASYNVLRYLARRDTLIAAIVLTRLRQVKAFSRIRTSEEVEKTNTTGFRVRKKAGTGTKAKGKASNKKEDLYNKFIVRCARPDIKPVERSFGDFLWRFARDRMELDQPCAERQLDRVGKLVQFFAVDGGSIRIVNPAKQKDLNAKYMQLYSNRPVALFKEEDMIFRPENLTTQMEYYGYATAEIETALKKVMAHLGIEETNARQFSPGSMPKGFMTMVNADISEEQMQILEARWRAQVAAYRGKQRIPFMPVPRGGKLEFIPLPQATDLEHGNFLDYLVNMLTALYGMDPAEINFPNRSGGIGNAVSPLIQSSPEATRLTASRDKGLRTLLAFLEDCINAEILPFIDDSYEDFEFTFIGFDRQTDTERLTADDKQSSTYKTVNEVRESHGLDPRDDCDVIRDGVWLQAQMAKQAQESGEGLTGDEEGATGEGGGEEWDSSTQGSKWATAEEPEDGDLW